MYICCKSYRLSSYRNLCKGLRAFFIRSMESPIHQPYYHSNHNIIIASFVAEILQNPVVLTKHKVVFSVDAQ